MMSVNNTFNMFPIHILSSKCDSKFLRVNVLIYICGLPCKKKKGKEKKKRKETRREREESKKEKKTIKNIKDSLRSEHTIMRYHRFLGGKINSIWRRLSKHGHCQRNITEASYSNFAVY